MSNKNPEKSNVNPNPSGQLEDQFDINESSYKTTHTAVRKARRFALQGLYEWLMTDRRFEQLGHGEWKENPPHDIAARTRATNAMHTVHLGYYHTMMREIPEQVEALEALIKKNLDRDIDKIDMVEHAVLLIGAYELKNSLHIPYKVVLDEAMKLNTHFGATDAHKLINAVMDKMAAELRAVEVEANADSGYKGNQKIIKEVEATSKDQTNERATDGVTHDASNKSLDNSGNNSNSSSSANSSTDSTSEPTGQSLQSQSEKSSNKSRISLKSKKSNQDN